MVHTMISVGAWFVEGEFISRPAGYIAGVPSAVIAGDRMRNRVFVGPHDRLAGSYGGDLRLKGETADRGLKIGCG